MQSPSRPPNPPDGSTEVAPTPEGSGEDPPSAGREPDSPSSRNRASLGVFQTRTIFHLPRRQSSGYFSFESDSQPNSPLSPKPLTADKATQTPSPACQVMNHALARGGGPGAQRQHASHSDTRRRNDMQAEAVGQQLRVMGDEYNRLLLQRREAARHEQDMNPLNLLPHVHQEPVAILCMSVLLLLIGRIIYLQGNMNSHDHPQV